MSVTAVLVAASGADWEAAALAALERSGAVSLARRCVDLADLLAAAAVGLGSVAVLSADAPGLDADSLARLARCGVAVVVVNGGEAPEDDVARLRRLGAEHVLAPTELDALVPTVLAAGRPGDEPASGPDDPSDLTGPEAGGSRGRLVVVWGPTGAPGRTTVAVGVAAGLAQAGGDVLLVDADGYGGAVAQHLGVLEEVSGLLAAARAANTGRLDPATLAGLARQVGPGLRLLTGLPRPDRWQEVRPAAYVDLLDQATRLAGHVVVDVGFSLEAQAADPFGSSAPQRNEMTLTSLERADDVVVVGSADPVGLSRLARGLVDLAELLPRVRPRVVVNRTRPTLGWSEREIRGMVEGFVRPAAVHFLPEDRATADRALMRGRSLADGDPSALVDALTGLVADLRGGPERAGRSGRLRRRKVDRTR